MKKEIVIAILICIVGLMLKNRFQPAPKFPEEKVVLICGASSGLGEQMAYKLAESKANIVLSARSEDKLLKVKKECLERGAAGVEIIPFDFSNAKDSGSVIDKTIEKFSKLDYLVLNHAAAPGSPFLATEIFHDPDYIETLFRINMFSNIQLVLKGLPYLEKSSGHILVTGSVIAQYPINYEMALYASTKAALMTFFYTLQQELIAMESPVGVTVGNLGLIWTPDIESLFQGTIVKYFSGDQDETVAGMINAYTTRPRYWSYPFGGTVYMTTMWQIFPWFHEMALKIGQVPGSSGYGYKEKVEEWNKRREISASRQFQRGYYKPPDVPAKDN